MNHKALSPLLYRTFIAPRSADPDARRREFVLNVLLSGLGLASLVSLANSLVKLVYLGSVEYVESFVMVPVLTGSFLVLLWLSRKGYSRYIAGLLVGSFIVLATYSLLSWSILLPMTQLLYALAIVLAGVLFRAKAAIATAILSSSLSLGIAYAQTQSLLHPDIKWLNTTPGMGDALGGALIFIIIGLVTWLANTEIDRALARARASEASLAEERDCLEIKVKERTRELEQEHLIRIMELQRFAELGKLSASILHDIANPLTVASLNIGQLNGSYKPNLIKQTEQSLRHIERYVESARKQLQASGSVTRFSPHKEARQVASILNYQARKQQVRISMDIPKTLQLSGDPIKFSQLVANLTMNAIESYENYSIIEGRVVSIIASQYKTGISISIHDNGKGIAKADCAHIFTPFYTKKNSSNRNLGLGLALVKETVEKDFHGTIVVKSTKKHGTTFTVRLFDA